MKNIEIRKETKKDIPAVHQVIAEAFQNEPYSDQSEHLLVKRLRNSDAFVPELSLVAISNNTIVGHIILTKIKIIGDDKIHDSLALAPVSVHPDWQKKGIRSQLIIDAHNKAKALGFQSIILIGHADYYPRFGYRQAHTFGIKLPFEAPKENCMACELQNNSLNGVSGLVEYPKEFFE